jgi:hypothetical protein
VAVANYRGSSDTGPYRSDRRWEWLRGGDWLRLAYLDSGLAAHND